MYVNELWLFRLDKLWFVFPWYYISPSIMVQLMSTYSICEPVSKCHRHTPICPRGLHKLNQSLSLHSSKNCLQPSPDTSMVTTLCMPGATLRELVAVTFLYQVTSGRNIHAVFDNVARWLFLLLQSANVPKNVSGTRCLTGNWALFTGTWSKLVIYRGELCNEGGIWWCWWREETESTADNLLCKQVFLYRLGTRVVL